MKEKEKETAGDRDPARMAYMIAWRDRYIEKLEETLQGREEETRLLEALLHCALCREGREAPFEVFLKKEVLSAALKGWHCAVSGEETGYRLRFTPITEEEGDAHGRIQGEKD